MATDEDLELQSEENRSNERPNLAKKSQAARMEIALERQDEVSTLLASIDPTKPLKEQKNAIDTLEALITRMILKKLNEEKDEKNREMLLARIRNFETSLTSTTPDEQEALSKLHELITAGTSTSREYAKRWISLCEKTSERFKKAADHKAQYERGEIPKETQWMSSTVRTGLLVAGAMGAIGLWRWLNTKKEDRKLGVGLLDAAVTTLGVGALIAPEKLGKWSAQLGLYLAPESIKVCWKYLKTGEFAKGFKALLFSAHYPGIEEAALALEIDKRLLLDLKDQSWKEFNSFHAQLNRSTKSSFASLAFQVLGIDEKTRVPLTNIDDTARESRQELRLVTFVKNNLDKIEGDPNTMTIGEILNALEKAGAFKAPGEGGNTEEGTHPNGEKPAEGKEGGEENSGIIAGTMEQARQYFAPTLTAIQETVDGTLSPEEGAKKVATTVLEGGGTLLYEKGTLFILKATPKGILAFYLADGYLVGRFFWDVLQVLHGNADVGDPIFNYFETAGIWVAGTGIIGAMKGGTVGLFTKGGRPLLGAAGGFIKGALWGIKTSFTLWPETIVFGIKGFEQARDGLHYLGMSINEIRALNVEERLRALRIRTEYYAQRYQDCHSRIENLNRSGGPRNWGARAYRRAFGEAWLERMTEHAGIRYLESREAFFGALNRADPLAADVSLTQFRNDNSSHTRVLRSAEEFATQHPESSLPRTPEWRAKTPAHPTHAEATRAGVEKLPRLSTALRNRLTTLGLDSDRYTLRFRELGFEVADFEELASQLESHPNPQQARKDFERILLAIKYPGLYRGIRAAMVGGTALGAITALYAWDHNGDATNELVSGLLGASAGAAGGFLVGASIGATATPHPALKPVGAALGAMAASFGAVQLWEHWGNPYLERNFPNRHQFWEDPEVKLVKDGLAWASGNRGIDTVLYIADWAGFGDGVEGDTQGLEYLRATKRISFSNRPSPGTPSRMHTLVELRENANEALANLEREKKDLARRADQPNLPQSSREEIARKQKENEEALTNVTRLADDTWINKTAEKLAFAQVGIIKPAFAHFFKSVSNSLGEAEGQKFLLMVQRIQQGLRGVTPEERPIWDYLCEQKIEIPNPKGEGKVEISFTDFLTLAYGVYQDALFLEKVVNEQKEHPLESKPKPSEQTPERGGGEETPFLAA